MVGVGGVGRSGVVGWGGGGRWVGVGSGRVVVGNEGCSGIGLG